MQVFNNMKRYSLDPREKSMDQLPFKWDSLQNIPDIAHRHKYKAHLIYAYIHGDIVFSTRPFVDRFDSGVAGVLLFPEREHRTIWKAEAFVLKLNSYNNGSLL